MNTYRELLKQNDADAWGLNNLGVLMFNRGEVQEALGPLARAVQAKPTAPLFLNNPGMALEQSGHLAAALNHYELAVKHDPSYAEADCQPFRVPWRFTRVNASAVTCALPLRAFLFWDA
jgi:tetratricopeptide (TPR) repeat protein